MAINALGASVPGGAPALGFENVITFVGVLVKLGSWLNGGDVNAACSKMPTSGWS